MKIVGVWMTFNNAPTMGYSLLSVYEVVDELLVLDGDFAGRFSDDGTLDIVESFRSYGPKPLTVMKVQASNLWEKRDVYIQHLLQRGGVDWIFQVDADEVYDERIVTLRNRLWRLPESVWGVGFWFHMFTHSLEYYKVDEVPGICFDLPQVRVHRLKAGMHYRQHAGGLEELCIESEPVWGQPQRAALWDDIRIYHYHVFYPLERRQEKLTRYHQWRGLPVEDVERHSMFSDVPGVTPSQKKFEGKHPWVFNKQTYRPWELNQMEDSLR
jgi:glycosyltransferase involved in cell wall biosynthesis